MCLPLCFLAGFQACYIQRWPPGNGWLLWGGEDGKWPGVGVAWCGYVKCVQTHCVNCVDLSASGDSTPFFTGSDTDRDTRRQATEASAEG